MPFYEVNLPYPQDEGMYVAQVAATCHYDAQKTAAILKACSQVEAGALEETAVRQAVLDELKQDPPITDVTNRVQYDLAALFGDVLFPDGQTSLVNLDVLRVVLDKHRAELVQPEWDGTAPLLENALAAKSLHRMRVLEGWGHSAAVSATARFLQTQGFSAEHSSRVASAVADLV